MSEQDQPALVLVVDDNEVNLDVLTRRLDRYGHAVETASNGRQALRMIDEKEYDLVLLDIMMPEMNGYEVLERIKQNPESRGLPVIVISALDDIESVVKCIKLGAEDYLSKPFNPMLLRARIAASLDKKRLRDREQAHLEEQTLTQRIDRELNTRLNIKRVCQITLDWARRRTAVDAVVIGLVREDGLKIIDSFGCHETLEYYDDGVLPLDSEARRRTIETILPQASEDPIDFLAAETKKQIIIPLGRGGELVALMLLESHDIDHFNNQRLSFLTRLGDRAGIAMANALLYEAVQEANLAKTQFVSTVSHELKNPMTSILNYAKMIASMGAVNEMQQSFIKTIISNVDRMSRLVSDLGDLSRIESGHLELDLRPVLLAEVVDEVVLSLRSQIQDKEQSVALNVPDDLPELWCDYGRLAQIMTNLLSNAHKYTPVGGMLTITAVPLPHNMIQISVQDNGLGLREEDQAKIFRKYFRAADDQAQASPGTGLGLNITKMLVELQGGTIWFESVFREGTSFHFTLPQVAPG